MRRLFSKRSSRPRHRHHIDGITARREGGAFRVAVVGWVVLDGERVARDLVLSGGGSEVRCTALYRPDFMAVPGGKPDETQLPGFRAEMTLPAEVSELVLSGSTPDGERVEIWRQKVDPARYLSSESDPVTRLSTFEFVRKLPMKPSAPRRPGLTRDRLVVDWIVPDFSRGAGGHVAIFRAIAGLEKEGVRCRIWIVHSSRHGSPEAVRRAVGESFVPVDAEVYFLLPEDIAQVDGDAGVATDRWTAYYLRSAPVGHRFYLVQDFEPAFYPAGAAYLLAENTYRFGFTTIVSSPWLASLMCAYQPGLPIEFRYGVDHATYHPAKSSGAQPPPVDPHRVVFYARANTERRAVEVGMVALEVLAERRRDFEVVCFGESLGDLRTPFPCRDAGILSASELAELYRSASVGLVFSATNHAIIPKEMMACGLPVMELDGASTRAVYPEDVLAWAPSDPFVIAEKLEFLLDHPKERERLRETGLRFVREFEWDEEIAKITGAIFESMGL